jgi:1-acyl-sn-glycerol-3-phosphate acyltransferase
MVCLGETEAVVTFFEPVDFDRFGDRKRMAEYCYNQVAFGLQEANAGRYDSLPPRAVKT